MQDEKEGDRYVINEFVDGTAWSILDTETHLVYALMMTRLSNFIFQFDLVELFPRLGSPEYLAFAQSILSARIEFSEPRVAIQMAIYVLNALRDGTDIANPVDIAIRMGADLYGQPAGWLNTRDIS